MTNRVHHSSAPPLRSVPLSWEVSHASASDAAPSRWVPATVPGAVQLDWARAEGWPEYWKGDNFKAYRWMEDVWWTYRAEIPVGLVSSPGERLIFRCGGVDYHYEVLFGGVKLLEHEGMFTPFELDLSDAAARGGVLEIRLRPAPKAPAAGDDRRQARLSVKPAVAYGWDWHPRLIPLGIWEETTLEVRRAARLLDVEVRYALDVPNRSADVTLSASVTTAAEGLFWSWRIRSPDGRVVGEWQRKITERTGTDSVHLKDLELWWPHDHGPQPLYSAEFTLHGARGEVLDSRTQFVGFRRVKLVMHDGAWDEPSGFPKSRSAPPVTIEINGRSIFGRGSNWVPPEIFPGLISADTYRPLLQYARDANFNVLRCWGGGIVNKQSFFDICDELGLLVWQEFPLACNPYEDDPHYLGVLDAESRAIIHRLRRHPSLALWCGGNELFNNWSGMTDQSFALRLLNRNCFDLDPTTPFIPTSPIDGVGHGDYRFRDDQGREVHQIFSAGRCTAYTEFGCPGPSPVDYIKTFIPPEELWPVRFGTAWETHHALMAWYPPSASSWLCLETQEHYFGTPADLATLVERGEWLQCEGYKVIFEEARRQKPRSSMALNWCFNEPWPSAANNNLLNWPARPKPAFHAVQAACRPVMVSAQIPKFAWGVGEQFSAEIWLFNDSPRIIPPGRINARVLCAGREVGFLEWQHHGTAANRHLRGPVLRCTLSGESDRFVLHVMMEGMPAASSQYTMPYVRVTPPLRLPNAGAPALNL